MTSLSSSPQQNAETAKKHNKCLALTNLPLRKKKSTVLYKAQSEATPMLSSTPQTKKLALSRQTESLVHALKHNAKHIPDHALIRWVNSHCEVESGITYEALWQQSDMVASLLLENNVKRGDRVMIAYPFGLSFLSGLFGCMRIGVIPCSVYPPNILDKSKARFSFEQFNNQVKDAGAKFALTSTLFKRGLIVAALSGHKTGSLEWLATDKLKASPTAKELEHQSEVSSDDIALIQYSSGSTGTPKGIMLTHGALLHNIKTVIDVMGDTGANSVVSWLPQYHDYGLILSYLLPCVSPINPAYACSPLDFIRDPLIWANMIEKFNATHIAGPNFAYALLAKRMKAANRKFNNTSLLQANIAAEPIAPTTLVAMKDVGIPASATMPCYGLAEVCVYATTCIGEEVRMNDDGVVSCGLMERNERNSKFIRVASDSGVVLGDGEVGEIYIRGPDLASGYWGKPELSKQFHCQLDDGEEYFATGDLGSIVDGRLYVVGRSKELIIINGKNIYPQDIERVIEAEYPNVVRPGSTAAFQNTDDDIGIALEIRKTVKTLDGVSHEFSVSSIKRLVNASCGANVGDIKFLKQGSIPKTTSGKLKRVASRKISLEGKWPADKLLLENAKRGLDLQVKGGKKIGVEGTIRSVIGHEIDLTANWDTNGLTSLMHAELISQVQEVHHVTLPMNFQQTLPTPEQLKVFVEKNTSRSFPVKLPNLMDRRSKSDFTASLSMSALSILQAIGIFLLLLVFALCLIPSYYVGKCTVDLALTFEVGDSGRVVTLSWLPVVVPVFFLSFSQVVIILKWVVVGRYKSGIVDLPSVSYLRWWFMDRLLDLWEMFVGSFIVETQMIWLFYQLMGARLAWSCQVDGFIREFDLVSVGRESSIEHQIRCRKFSVYNNFGVPSLVMRPICVGDQCAVKGMMEPGVDLSDSSKIDKHGAVAEGTQVSSGVLVEGSPAFNSGPYESHPREPGYWLVEVGKGALLVVELYHFFALFLFAQIILNQQLPADWRYTSLIYWIIILPLTSSLGVVSSIVLKWLLIGRRRPGYGSLNAFCRLADWFCDYHFNLVVMTLFPLLGMSRIWNIILFLHGLDIDMASFPSEVVSFPPSKVDLLHIRRSFLSTIGIDTTDPIEIFDSNIGYNVQIRGGAKIHRSVIPPRRVVEDNIYDANFNNADQQHELSGIDQVLLELSQVVCALLVVVSFGPAYELFVATMFSATLGAAIPWLCLVLLVQCFTWILAERLVQAMVQVSNRRMQNIVYSASLVVACANRLWNLLFLCARGTPVLTGLLFRFMGARVDGELWYFGNAIYDFHMLHFEDKTVVDDAHVSGHYVVYGNVTLDGTRVGGIVHPGTYCPAGSTLKGAESGPWKVYLGDTTKADGTLEVITERPDMSESDFEYDA